MTVAVAVASPRTPQRSMWVVGVGLLLYTLAYLVYYPDVVTVTDEAAYVERAFAFAHGRTTTVAPGEEVGSTPQYAPGTSLLMTPFVALLGWRGAYVVPLLGVIVLVLLLAQWLADAGRSPLWAMLMLGYPPLLAQGRVGMSDVPSAAAVVLALWLLWRGDGRAWGWWLAAGLAGAASLFLREPCVLLIAPFFLGALIRRGRRAWPLVLGGVIGLAVGLGVVYAIHGQWVARSSELKLFALEHVPRNLVPWLMAVVVLVPGGLLAAAFYRGPQRVELQAAVAGFSLLHLLWWYNGAESGFMKGLILGTPRLCIPLAPLLIFALAEAVPRGWNAFLARLPHARRALTERIARAGIAAAILAIFCAAVAVHPVLTRWSRPRLAIREAIYAETTPGAALITNVIATGKFINAMYGPRTAIDTADASPQKLAAAIERFESAYVVLVSRSDSEFWRETAVKDERMIDDLCRVMQLTPAYDRQIGATDRLRVWKARALP